MEEHEKNEWEREHELRMHQLRMEEEDRRSGRLRTWIMFIVFSTVVVVGAISLVYALYNTKNPRPVACECICECADGE